MRGALTNTCDTVENVSYQPKIRPPRFDTGQYEGRKPLECRTKWVKSVKGCGLGLLLSFSYFIFVFFSLDNFFDWLFGPMMCGMTTYFVYSVGVDPIEW